MSDNTTTLLQKVRDDLLQRAQGFSSHDGIFNGRLVGEELRSWVKRLDEVINDG